MTSNENPQTFINVAESKTVQEQRRSTLAAAWLFAKWRLILSEFLCNCVLLSLGCMTFIPIRGLEEQSPMYATLGYGLMVMFNVQVFGHISGAYMNPAVTLASVIWGNTSIVLGVCYAVAQIIGSTIGYGILIGLAPIDVTGNGICVAVPHPGLNPFQMLVIEILLTGALALVCCSLWDPVNENMQDSAPIKFGLVIVAFSLAGGHLTGAVTNPARYLGPAIWTGTWDVHWVYWAGPFIGAALSASFYRYVFVKSENLNY